MILFWVFFFSSSRFYVSYFLQYYGTLPLKQAFLHYILYRWEMKERTDCTNLLKVANPLKEQGVTFQLPLVLCTISYVYNVTAFILLSNG